ncbi:MAG: 4Fe-4S binding protein [Methanolinea sp.]|nr:4Fe-4S binding protein [Methanolinea sp.]
MVHSDGAGGIDPDLAHEIREKCDGLDIPLVGFAPVERWDRPPFEPWVPAEFRPAAIYPETRTVIVIGLPVSLPVLETAPSIWYHELYRTVNTLLDEYGYRIASFLSAKGHPSVPVPRDGYGSISILKERPTAFFSHRHAAFCAGLGTFGVNNMLLTREFGPRVRFTSILTSARLPPDPVSDEGLCTHCNRCVEACPVRALEEGEYPATLTDKRTCATRSEDLNRRSISPCGLCIRVCPVGRDRALYRREDTGIYDGEEKGRTGLHRAWAHVRAYGGG